MYEQLDAMILGNIRAKVQATILDATRCGNAGAEADRIAAITGRESFRVSDGRLQALRKRGLIYHTGGTWRCTTPKD